MEATDRVSFYAKQAIDVLQLHIKAMGYTPVVHFELEGGYAPSAAHSKTKHHLEFNKINAVLKQNGIQGEVKPEFWFCQWEWASLFEGQPPIKAAQDLEWSIKMLPQLLKKHGATDVWIKPVIWNGAEGRMMEGSRSFFAANSLPVHIPNSIQMNISALNAQNRNAIPENSLGEILQECFLETSYECCLLYTPEAEAFERLSLKEKYGLAQELSSPQDLSGGHQGSIALYKELGKHNQKMGEKHQIYDAYERVVSSTNDWQFLSRIEHRLGSASIHYNAYANTVFALANLSDALMITLEKRHSSESKIVSRATSNKLPDSLYGKEDSAYALFQKSEWFIQKINSCVSEISAPSYPVNLGNLLHSAILASVRDRSVGNIKDITHEDTRY